MNKNDESQLKLEKNISYNLISTMPSKGWVAKFKDKKEAITLVGWATVRVGANLPHNGFNGSRIIGLVCIGGNNIVPCELVESFDCYIEQIPTVNVFND